ncbi:C6 transcription factor [Colletotrichum kahawae]|uniref:C6 transcription factor n=1 Tax=Colletotrichum kahawae TaxID=34407 RepID=A0AAE0DBJ1_COLKA|nr:C6 transcription factor [Colletotrichum kahawae]
MPAEPETPPVETTGRRKRPRVPDDQRKRVKIARSCSNPTSDVERKDDREEELQLLQEIFSRGHPDVPIEARALERFRSHLVAQTSDDTAGNSPSTEAVGQSGNVTLDQTTSQDVIYCDAVSTHAASVTVVNQGKTHFEDTSSLWSFFTSMQQVFAGDVDEENENGDADCRDISLHQVSDLSFGTDWRTSVNAALPPQEVVNYLTTSFFEHGQANYFCVHPEIFSRKLTAFYDGTHEFEARDSRNSRRSIEFISILFMVLAIGSQFADTGISPSFETSIESNRLLVEEGLHSLKDMSRIKVPVPAPNIGWRFYEASRKLLPDIICSSSMASVQVCALQGIYLPSTGSRDASYNVLGLALRMAINMGLHTTFAAASLHAHVPMAQICHLLGRIVGAVYNRTAAEKGTIIRPKVIHQLERDLEQWRRDLPKHVNLENFTTRSEAHLALTFEQATILLTRSCLNYNAVTRKSDKPLAPNATKFLEHQAQQCVDSAVTCVRIMAKLKSLSLLCAPSFHDSLHCSSALHVLLLARVRLAGTIAAPMKIISQGILILAELAMGSEAAASSLRGIVRAMANVSTNTDRLHHERNHTSLSLRRDQTQQQGRDAWKNWITSQSMPRSQTSSTIETHLETDFDRNRHYDVRQEGSASAIWSPVDFPPSYGQEGAQRWDGTSIASDLSDITYPWVAEHLEFDVLSRDLGGVPEFDLLC